MTIMMHPNGQSTLFSAEFYLWPKEQLRQKNGLA